MKVITAVLFHPTFSSGGQPTVTERVMGGIRAMLITWSAARSIPGKQFAGGSFIARLPR
jgi:hypothetical protein